MFHNSAISSGLNHAAHTIAESTQHLFNSEDEAYKYMWESSYKYGRVYKEHAAYVLEDGRVLLLPRHRNTHRTSKIYENKLKMDRNGKETIRVGFKRYVVGGFTHTHPLNEGYYYPNGGIGVSPQDIRFMSRHHNLWFKTIYNGDIYRVWHNGDHVKIGTVQY